MGGKIFIEADDAEFVGLPVGARHLYLVHRDTDGHEYVIRSGPSSSWWPFGTEMKVEANVPIERSEDARGDESPADRASTLLDFPDLTTDAAWAIMVKYARLIASADYPYHLLQENSNAFVGAMLAAAGGEPSDLLPKGVDADEAVGFSSFGEILDDIAPPPNGTLYGTEFADLLQGIQVGERIVAGGGDDIVRAGRGDDYVVGGAGNDRLNGQYGFDRLLGGVGNDRLYASSSGDTGTPDEGTTVLADQLYGEAGRDKLFGSVERDLLYGGDGNDTLRGAGGSDRLAGGSGADLIDGGTGSNRLYGNTGADAFYFVGSALSNDRVYDFEDGTDLIRIEGDTLSSFDDLVLRRAGSAGEHTVITFETTRVILLYTDLDLIDAADFEIVPGAGLIV